jgi:hypothetical protein
MTSMEITQALRRAFENAALSLWELGRRADVKERFVEAAMDDVSKVSVEAVVRLADALDLELRLVPVTPRARRVGEVASLVDLAIDRVLAGEVEVEKVQGVMVVLRFEGVLASGTTPPRARPGLRRFLELCRPLASCVAVVTGLPEPVFRSAAQTLVQEEVAPVWFAAARCVHTLSELTAVDGSAEGPDEMLLVVDAEGSPAVPNVRCVTVGRWEPGNDPQASELDAVLTQLAGMALQSK